MFNSLKKLNNNKRIKIVHAMGKVKFHILLVIGCCTLISCPKPQKEMNISNGSAIEVTSNTAIVSAQIIDLGEGATQYGHCYSKTEGVDIHNSMATDKGMPKDLISFTSELNNLEAGTKYYYNAYISDGIVQKYGREASFTTDIDNQTTVTDIDQNIYGIISLGNQLWTIENLRTTRFNDGISIPFVPDNSSWESLTAPGYSWYNNEPAVYGPVYGAVYNWYTANSGKLCPDGWHVPSDAEWIILENYLIANGYNFDGTTSGNKIAKSLAATTNWTPATQAGTPGNTDYPSYRNKSKFTALPGGYRSYDGSWHSLNIYGGWWSSLEADAATAMVPSLGRDTVSVFRLRAAKTNGHYVRCIKN
jgi:uncharacterized protein (TIGR02145 family)